MASDSVGNWFLGRVKRNLRDSYYAGRHLLAPVGRAVLGADRTIASVPSRMWQGIRSAPRTGGRYLGHGINAVGSTIDAAGQAARAFGSGLGETAPQLFSGDTGGSVPKSAPMPGGYDYANASPAIYYSGAPSVPAPAPAADPALGAGDYTASAGGRTMTGNVGSDFVPGYSTATGGAAPMSKILNDERLAAFNRQPGAFIGTPSYAGNTMSAGQRAFMRDRGLLNTAVAETPQQARTRFLGQMPARTVQEQRAKAQALAQAQQGDITAGQQAGLARAGMASQERSAQSAAAGMAGKMQQDAATRKYIADMHVKAAQLSQSNTVPPRVKEASKMVFDAIKEGSDVNPLAQGIVDDYLQQGEQQNAQQEAGSISGDDEQALAWASENLHSPGNSIKAQQIMANLEKKYGTKIKAIKPKA